MQETRHQFRESLKELENQVLGGLDLVIGQLDRALESVSYQDVELAAMVVADDDRDGPLGGQQGADGPADAPGPAGDDDDLVV